jgi:ankyrin repeat protein
MNELNEFIAAIIGGDATQVNLSIGDDGESNTLVNAPLTRYGRTTALILAAQHGHVAVVELLLNRGAFIDDVNDKNQTACFVAAQFNQLSVLQLLLARGANSGICDVMKRSPLNMAVLFESDRIALALIQAGAPLDDTGVVCVAAAMSTTIAEMLLVNKSINFAELRGSNGETPCHISAVRSDKPDVIEFLVTRAGVDLNVRDKSGDTCAHPAASFGHEGVLRKLIELGANLDIGNRNSWTPLHFACYRRHARCVKMLIAGGASVHVKSLIGQTACHVAAASDAILAMLLAAGADFDEVDNRGDTPRTIVSRRNGVPPSDEQIELMRQEIVALVLPSVRGRALQVCIGLQPLELNALQTCEILINACGRAAPLVPFHRWWQIATTVKHFKTEKMNVSK